MKHVALVEPTEELTAEFLEMADEYHLCGDDRYQEVLDGVTEYFAKLRHWASGKDLPSHIVQESEFWLVREKRVLGVIRLRHRLNEVLSLEGGHIGYDIRPSERGKGYATAMLRMTLERAREIGLKKVMLTCDDDNIASIKVIENNGGNLTGFAVSPRTGRKIRQYWIEL